MHYCILWFLINMICFFLNIRLFFIGKSTLAAHYFPIISTFVLDVGVCRGGQCADWSCCSSVSPPGGSSSLMNLLKTLTRKAEAALLLSLLLLWFSQCQLINYISGGSLVLFCEVMLLHKFGIWCFILVRIKKMWFLNVLLFHWVLPAAAEQKVLERSDSVWWRCVTISLIQEMTWLKGMLIKVSDIKTKCYFLGNYLQKTWKSLTADNFQI